MQTDEETNIRDLSVLALPKAPKSITQIVLGPGPLQRHALAGLFFQRLTIGGGSLFEFCRPVLASSKIGKRITQSFTFFQNFFYGSALGVRRDGSARADLGARGRTMIGRLTGVATVDLPPEATMAGVPQLMLDTGGYPINSSAPQGDPAVRATTAERPLAL